MTERLPSDALMDAVLSGVADASTPPGLDRVATLVRAARTEPTAAEREIPPALLAALAGSVERTAPARAPVSRMKRRLAAAAGAVVLTSSGMAAAATTNSLPAPIQHAVADAASHVGVQLPRPAATAPTTPSTGRTPPATSSTTVVTTTASTEATTTPGRAGSSPPPRSVPHTNAPRPTTPQTTHTNRGNGPPDGAGPPATTSPHRGGTPPTSPPTTHPGGGHGRDGEHGRADQP
jgi:hypothetical protein